MRFEVEGDAGTLPAGGGHAAGGGAHRAAAERRRPRLPASATCRRHGQVRSSSTATAPALPLRVIDDGVGLPEGFASSVDRPRAVDRADAGASELTGTIDIAPGDGAGERPGTCRHHPDRPRTVVTRSRVAGRRRAERPRRSGPLGGADRSERGGQEALRCWASQARRSLRRSSSEVPPQTPESWLVTRANSRQAASAAQLAAHGLGLGDLLDGRPGGADREEQVGARVATGGEVAPVLSFDRYSAEMVRATVSPTGTGGTPECSLEMNSHVTPTQRAQPKLGRRIRERFTFARGHCDIAPLGLRPRRRGTSCDGWWLHSAATPLVGRRHPAVHHTPRWPTADRPVVGGRSARPGAHAGRRPRRRGALAVNVVELGRPACGAALRESSRARSAAPAGAAQRHHPDLRPCRHHPFPLTVTADFVAAAHAGLTVNIWTVDDPDRIAELAGLGVDGIVTNVPDAGRFWTRPVEDQAIAGSWRNSRASTSPR